MGGDKHGSKSGRYGGLLQLFDWNAKSRKKLFSSKSDSPEQSKQGKKSDGNLPSTRIRLVDEDEYGNGLSVRGGSDYSCASSVTDDDLYGTKAPGVVARLMGLDSLPTSIPLEPYSTPFFDTLSLRDAPLGRRNIDYYHDHQMMHSRQLSHKVESPPRQTLDTRYHKMLNRPIEKFQTEILPPKSAKMIPITQNRLLSPIKSPIFVPSQDAAHIMEAAAKIIEPGPHAAPRSRLSSSSGSSSVPFKVRELKEKLEGVQKPSKAAEPFQRPVESNAAKYLKGQPLNKSWNGSLDTTSFKVSPSSSRDDGSVAGVKNKGKSISLAIQAKVNVQQREGLAQSSRSLGGAEEQDDNKSIKSFRSQPNGPRIINRKSSAQTSSSVLRQNNQKQNSSTYRDKPASKPSVAMSTGKKVVSEESSQGRQKISGRDVGSSRTSSRKSSLEARDGDKDIQHSGVKNAPRKKRSIENMQASKHEKPSHNKISDKHFSWIEESRRKGMDVVSFTFTAPITRSLSGPELSKHLAEKSGNLSENDRSKMSLSSDVSRISSPTLNGIRGDALSILLEQKLKELTSNLETSSDHSFINTSIESESSQIPGSGESNSLEKKAQQVYSSLSSIESEELRKFKFQGLKTMDKYTSTKDERKQWNDCHLPCAVSTLEPSSVLTESCYSESIESSTTEESKLCASSVRGQEVLAVKNQTTETETDTLDSGSSTSSQTGIAKDAMKSTAWELGYVKDMLSTVELMFRDYATGRTREIVSPHLFDQMERRRVGGTRKDEFSLERKLLFDCVSECLDLRCQRFIGGGFETWAKGIDTVKRKERLAEEVYKEILGWRSLGNSIVDELVDKDMSSKYGRWLDFEADEFMLGVEIEDQILDSLVVEIVADISPSNFSLR